MWAQARVLLGLTSEEFWDLTLRELEALFDAYGDSRRSEVEINRYLIAEIQATLYNVQRTSSTQRVLKATDFVNLPGQAAAAGFQAPSKEAQLARVKLINKLVGGTEAIN